MNELRNSQTMAPPHPPQQPSTLSDRVRSLRLPDRPSRQLGMGTLVLLVLCLGLAGSTGYLGWRVFGFADVKLAAPPEKIEPKENTPGNPRPVAPVAEAPGGVAHTGKGNIVPYQQVQVSPKVGGTVM